MKTVPTTAEASPKICLKAEFRPAPSAQADALEALHCGATRKHEPAGMSTGPTRALIRNLSVAPALNLKPFVAASAEYPSGTSFVGVIGNSVPLRQTRNDSPMSRFGNLCSRVSPLALAVTTKNDGEPSRVRS